jgi:hypothetical protein
MDKHEIKSFKEKESKREAHHAKTEALNKKMKSKGCKTCGEPSKDGMIDHNPEKHRGE